MFLSDDNVSYQTLTTLKRDHLADLVSKVEKVTKDNMVKQWGQFSKRDKIDDQVCVAIVEHGEGQGMRLKFELV